MYCGNPNPGFGLPHKPVANDSLGRSYCQFLQPPAQQGASYEQIYECCRLDLECPAESTSTPSHGARKAAVAPKPEGLAGRSPKRPTMKGMGDTKMGKVQEGDAKMKEGIAL